MRIIKNDGSGLRKNWTLTSVKAHRDAERGGLKTKCAYACLFFFYHGGKPFSVRSFRNDLNRGLKIKWITRVVFHGGPFSARGFRNHLFSRRTVVCEKFVKQFQRTGAGGRMKTKWTTSVFFHGGSVFLTNFPKQSPSGDENKVDRESSFSRKIILRREVSRNNLENLASSRGKRSVKLGSNSRRILGAIPLV